MKYNFEQKNKYFNNNINNIHTIYLNQLFLSIVHYWNDHLPPALGIAFFTLLCCSYCYDFGFLTV